MNLKLALITASVMALLMGAARADQNFANVEQSGSDNDGVVTQSGSGNDLGTVADAALQHGADNRLEILQSGGNNEIGARGLGFEQRHDRNEATIGQYSNGNIVGEVIQNGKAGDADPRNTLDIVQGASPGAGDDNAIWRVEQVKQGNGGANAGNDAKVRQTGARNEIGSEATGGTSQRGRNHSLVVRQTSDGNNIGDIAQRGRDAEAKIVQEEGNANSVGSVTQRGRHNTLMLTQTGALNNVTSVSQDSRGNDATLSFEGDGNGVGDFEGELTGLAALLTGVSQGVVTQALGANTLSYRVEGNRNRFGFAQQGDGNRIDGSTIGRQNETVAYQQGDGNGFDFLQDGYGAGNETALGQVGNNNNAMIHITGSLNLAGITQLGNRNDADIVIGGNKNAILVAQFQNKNHAQVTIDGNRNFAGIAQSHTAGAANRVTLDITGSNNNNPLYSGVHDFTGAALAAAGPLVPGAILQSGHGNTIDMTVGGTVTSNANMFAFSQDGSGNAIVGVVDGAGNQAVVVQMGVGNFTSFSQSGSYNIIGVNQ